MKYHFGDLLMNLSAQINISPDVKSRATIGGLNEETILY